MAKPQVGPSDIQRAAIDCTCSGLEHGIISKPAEPVARPLKDALRDLRDVCQAYLRVLNYLPPRRDGRLAVVRVNDVGGYLQAVVKASQVFIAALETDGIVMHRTPRAVGLAADRLPLGRSELVQEVWRHFVCEDHCGWQFADSSNAWVSLEFREQLRQLTLGIQEWLNETDAPKPADTGAWSPAKGWIMSQQQVEDWRSKCSWHVAHCVQELRAFRQWFKNRKGAVDAVYWPLWDGTQEAPAAESAAWRVMKDSGACCVQLGEFYAHGTHARDLLTVHDAPDRAISFMQRVDEVANLACELDNRARTRPLQLVQESLITAIDDLDRFGMELLHALDTPKPAGASAERAAAEDGELVQAANRLTDRQRYILQAMLKLKAFDRDSRQTTEEIAKRAESSNANPDNFKQPMADLSMKGYTEGKRGVQGGVWLAPTGRKLAEFLANG